MRKSKKSFSLIESAKSFSHAFNGIITLICTEHNAQIHIFGAILAFGFCIALHVNKIEWVLVVFSVALVFICELLNSGIEKLGDLYTTEFHPLIKIAKDFGAAAVFIATLNSLVLAAIIFIPKICRLL